MDSRVPLISLTRILDSLRQMAAVEAAVVMDRAGHVIAASCPRTRSAKAIAAACSRVLAATEGEALAEETPVRVDIRGKKGSTILVTAGNGAVLAVVARTTTPESLSLELARVADEVRFAVAPQAGWVPFYAPEGSERRLRAVD